MKRIEFYNAHRCTLYASVNGVDSTVRFAMVRNGSQRFASVCSVNGAKVYAVVMVIKPLMSLQSEV